MGGSLPGLLASGLWTIPNREVRRPAQSRCFRRFRLLMIEDAGCERQFISSPTKGLTYASKTNGS